MRNLWLIGCLVIVMAVSVLPTSGRAACLASVREIKFADGSARMKAYSCSLRNGVEPVLQVEFDRLSEAAAGNLIAGAPYKDLRNVYGTWKVLHNKVFNVAKKLFDSYGIRMVGENCFGRNLVSAQRGGSHAPDIGCEKRVLWYLTFPDRENLTTIEYPESWKPIITNNKWPSGWHFFYTGCGKGHATESLLSCAILWRPVRQQDLANYARDVLRSEVKIGAPMNTDNGQVNSHSDPEVKRYFLLVDHIAHRNLPEDFLTLVDSDPASCGCGAVGNGIHIRQLVLHTAFVKNTTHSALTIDSLLQEADDSELLRPYTEGQNPTSFQNVSVGQVVLAPGETLAIPLRVKFVPADSLTEVFDDLASANETFRRIHNYKNEFLKSANDCDQKISVQRDSFGPPTVPTPNIYSYGSAVTLKGISVSGTPIEFDKPLGNFLQITAGEGYGSCPYVYAYDNRDEEWGGMGTSRENHRQREYPSEGNDATSPTAGLSYKI